MTNNDDMKQFFKKFHNDDNRKGFLMTLKKCMKVP